MDDVTPKRGPGRPRKNPLPPVADLDALDLGSSGEAQRIYHDAPQPSAGDRVTVRLIRPMVLSPSGSRAVESYTGVVIESAFGVMLPEHGARIPWSNVGVIHPPMLTEAEIRRGPSTADEEQEEARKAARLRR